MEIGGYVTNLCPLLKNRLLDPAMWCPLCHRKHHFETNSDCPLASPPPKEISYNKKNISKNSPFLFTIPSHYKSVAHRQKLYKITEAAITAQQKITESLDTKRMRKCTHNENWTWCVNCNPYSYSKSGNDGKCALGNLRDGIQQKINMTEDAKQKYSKNNESKCISSHCASLISDIKDCALIFQKKASESNMTGMASKEIFKASITSYPAKIAGKSKVEDCDSGSSEGKNTANITGLTEIKDSQSSDKLTLSSMTYIAPKKILSDNTCEKIKPMNVNIISENKNKNKMDTAAIPGQIERSLSSINIQVRLPHLSMGSISKILEGEEITGAVVQILGYEKLPGSRKDNYLLFISDGVSSIDSSTECLFTCMDRKFNNLVTDNELKEFTIIQVKRYICYYVQPVCKVIILLDFDVLVPGIEIRKKIGIPIFSSAPVAISTRNNAELNSILNTLVKNIIPQVCFTPQILKPPQQVLKPPQQVLKPPRDHDLVQVGHPVANLTPYENRIRGQQNEKNEDSVKYSGVMITPATPAVRGALMLDGAPYSPFLFQDAKKKYDNINEMRKRMRVHDPFLRDPFLHDPFLPKKGFHPKMTDTASNKIFRMSLTSHPGEIASKSKVEDIDSGSSERKNAANITGLTEIKDSDSSKKQNMSDMAYIASKQILSDNKKTVCEEIKPKHVKIISKNKNKSKHNVSNDKNSKSNATLKTKKKRTTAIPGQTKSSLSSKNIQDAKKKSNKKNTIEKEKRGCNSVFSKKRFHSNRTDMASNKFIETSVTSHPGKIASKPKVQDSASSDKFKITNDNSKSFVTFNTKEKMTVNTAAIPTQIKRSLYSRTIEKARKEYAENNAMRNCIRERFFSNKRFCPNMTNMIPNEIFKKFITSHPEKIADKSKINDCNSGPSGGQNAANATILIPKEITRKKIPFIDERKSVESFELKDLNSKSSEKQNVSDKACIASKNILSGNTCEKIKSKDKVISENNHSKLNVSNDDNSKSDVTLKIKERMTVSCIALPGPREESLSNIKCHFESQKPHDIHKASSSDMKQTVIDVPTSKGIQDHNYTQVPWMLIYPEIKECDLKCLDEPCSSREPDKSDEEKYLNDTIIEFYLKYISNEKLTPEQRQKTYILSSYFFPKLEQEQKVLERTGKIPERNIVKTWLKNADMFSKDFILIPINESKHWYLMIIYFLSKLPKIPLDGSKTTTIDETVKGDIDKTKRPCICFFDSARDILWHKKLKKVETLKKFLMRLCLSKQSNYTYDFNQLIPRNVRCPKQEDKFSCGIFLLQFAEHFFQKSIDWEIENRPSVSHWFSSAKIPSERRRIKKIIEEIVEKKRRLIQSFSLRK